METIQLIQLNEGKEEVLEGIGPDDYWITDEMIAATHGNMRIFPHIVSAVAENIRRKRELNQAEHLEVMRSVRDGLIAAINERKITPGDIMVTTTSGNA